ncbi:hypothetical protein [Candidatus Jordarchaeum sp.]|uniref:hypothetical protein n=1 Tax=Candidatus Jordarchaeum sp. TaxID=2823881 RepID=UPI00404965F6
MTEVGSFERFRFWGWRISVVCVAAFLVVVGLSLVFGSGINGIFILPVISLILMGLATVFVGGLILELYGSIRIWLKERSTPSQTSGRRRARREGD